MNDKQQIKEMASDIDYACTKKDLYPSDTKEIAKALYLLGYRKIPEDSVVLTKKEYETLMDIKALQTQVEESLSNISNEDIANIEQQARKETAKEILKGLISNISEIKYDAVCEKIVYIDDIKELAKQYGVEVK